MDFIAISEKGGKALYQVALNLEEAAILPAWHCAISGFRQT